MHLQKLTLENFGPYYGTQSVDLDVSREAPVVLFYGENTLGKTQLFSALRWCMYGSLSSSQSQEEDSEVAAHLNNIAKREGSNRISVGLTFEHEGQVYVLNRVAIVEQGRPVAVTASLRIGASVVPSSTIDSVVGRIIHPQIADFFLFDAETLSRFYERLADDRQRGFIKESIEQVLGIPALQIAKRDISELVNDALDRQAKADKSVLETQRIRQRLRKLASEASSLERDRAELQETLTAAERELERTREALQRASGLEGDLREQETLEAQISDGEREISQIKAEIKNLFARGWMAVANARLSEKLDQVRSANNVASERGREISELRQKVALLEGKRSGGVCPTCGQELSADPTVETDLATAREALGAVLAGSPSGEVDLRTERRIAALIDNSILPDFTAKTRRINEISFLQFERKGRLDSISERLKGHSLAEIRRLGSQQQDLTQVIKGSISALEKSREDEIRIGQEQRRLARQLERLSGADPKVVLEATFLRLVQESLDRTVDKFRERVRVSVEDSATDMFLGLIRDSGGYGGLQIGPDYRVNLVDTRGDMRPTSEGGKQLVALSLIGALKLAAARGGPVVIDSPLGRLDLQHRENVLRNWIPRLGTQAVLLVQSGELTRSDADRLLGTTVGRAYTIRRPSGDPEYAVIESA
ncbi:AAA family ATPase [Micromonospora aurantiaca]|uniref:AAA family ATPase n=1 Tax=Micromonospora aurantiaca (nom. illeg.) TaxID=47850 RepID=UPI00341C231C